jgi:dephospho-CoA kinase
MGNLSPMDKAGRKPVIGIIGGMCSGKSTVAAKLAKMGCAVIDADRIAHQLLDDKAVRAKIIRVFGKEILEEGGPSTPSTTLRTGSLRTGKISRSELANKVFGDADKLGKLTGILHPPVLAQVEELIARHRSNPAVKAIVLDMPLLVEVGWEKRCDHIIFVDCDPPIRLERAKKAGFFDADELKIRENLQISLDKKRRIADNIIENNSDLSGLSKQIADIFTSIMDNSSRRKQG